MDRLKRLTQAMGAVSLAISAVIAQQAVSWVEKQPAAARWLPPVVALVIVGFGSHSLRFVLDLLFENSRRLRRRLLGRQFIEGNWFIIFRAEGKPTAVGVTRIESAGTSVRFSGEEFLVEEGKVVEEGRGHYLTDLVVLDWPRIRYVYTDNQSSGNSSRGYGEAQFVEGDRSCQKFSGRFLELLGNRTTYYDGWRIDDDEILGKLEGPTTRGPAIADFFDKMKTRNSTTRRDEPSSGTC